MSAPAFLRRLRDLAADSKNVFITNHARRRMVQRRHTDEDVRGALLRGIVSEGPFLNDKGHWQATIYRTHADQEITVVAALDDDVIVITVI
ncbi:MAG: DUF4258 domain-containing protein [Proteobacteria bacterium]|nr:DUF4258 domain-containing protein [Pseudomonadota bacterium]